MGSCSTPLRRDGAVRVGVLDVCAAAACGPHHARRLTTACHPVGAVEALAIGLVDAVIGGDRETFEAEVLARATALAAGPEHDRLLAARRAELHAITGSVPLRTYRCRELAEMHADIFDDRQGFSSARFAFVSKQPRGHPVAPAAVPGRGEAAAVAARC